MTMTPTSSPPAPHLIVILLLFHVHDRTNHFGRAVVSEVPELRARVLVGDDDLGGNKRTPREGGRTRRACEKRMRGGRERKEGRSKESQTESRNSKDR